MFGFGERGLWKRVFFRKVHSLEILENVEILEFLENPQTLENKGESDHFLEILVHFLEILEMTPSGMTPFSGPEVWKPPGLASLKIP